VTPLDEELILGFERILRADREFRSVEPPERLAFGFVWEQPDPDDVDARAGARRSTSSLSA
jgi:hypothetical protein